jgi:hypothetical protein
MSTAFFPSNMRHQSSSGYSNHSTLQNIPYIPWKGTGIYSNPIGITSTNIRPLTNKDPGNVFPTGFGLPRPMKHYRKGRVIPIHYALNEIKSNNNIESNIENNISNIKSIENIEADLINYNLNRAVKSSYGSTGLISDLIDTPGGYIIKENTITTDDPTCVNCNGISMVSNWMPIRNLTEKPEPNVTNPPLCCNQQLKAIKRVLPTSTNIEKNYYQTTYMYLYNRCQTFKQRQFNFLAGIIDPNLFNVIKTYPFISDKIIDNLKPGDPLSNINYYVAQCNPNFVINASVEIAFINSLIKSLLDAKFINKTTYDNLLNQKHEIPTFITTIKPILSNEQYQIFIDFLYQLAIQFNNNLLTGTPKGCSKVYYKPNNPQYAKQGAVSSSTRLLKLNVNTISTSAYQNNKFKNNYINTVGLNQTMPFVYKDKVPPCQPQVYSGNPFFFQGQFQNKNICHKS